MININSNKMLKIFLLLFFVTIFAKAKELKEITRIEGQPVQLVFDDGTQAQVVRKESRDEFVVPIEVTENSCQEKATQIKCVLRVPYIRLSYAAKWVGSNGRANQAVQYSFNKNITYGTQFFVTKDDEKFFKTFNQKKLSFTENAQANHFENQDDIAFLSCEGNLKEVLPENDNILFIDEKYESGNRELAIRGGYGTRINLFWRRHIDTQIINNGSEAIFKKPRLTMATEAFEYPFMFGYSFQMSFDNKNFINSEDSLCQIKWSINFSRYFDQVQKLYLGEDKPINLKDYSSLLYTSGESDNPYYYRFLQNQRWSADGVE